jgi:hypothetical protein
VNFISTSTIGEKMFGIRSILAIVIGFAVAIAIVWGSVTFLEHNDPAIQTKRSGQLLVLAAAGLGGLAGGFLAATVASTRRRLHAIVVGILLGAAGFALFILFPDRETSHDPLWYRYSFPVLALITAIVGGRVRSRN